MAAKRCLRATGTDLTITASTRLVKALFRHPPRILGASGRNHNASTPRSRERESGFTLLEILVVIVILGLLIGLVAPAALRQLGGAKTSIARQSIERLAAVMDLYRLDTGSYPSTEQGVQALVVRPSGVAGWNGPYIKGDQVPVDPWNNPFVYRMPSTRSGRDFDLCSRGPNAQDGTGAQDALICNP